MSGSPRYTLDILAWDVFSAFSMLFAAPVFRTGRLKKRVQILMIASGVLSLAGLIGVPLAGISIRNIGVLGHVGAGLVVFPLLGVAFGRAREVPEEAG